MESGSKHSSLEKTARQLAMIAYKEIQRKYGVHGLKPKRYHNAIHAKDVVSAGLSIISMAIDSNMASQEDKALVIIAGAYHDIEQDLGSGANEQESADMAAKAMRKTGLFNEQDIDRVVWAILATTIIFQNGKIIQSPGDDFLERAVADGDLSNLGYPTDIFKKRSLGLFYEQNPNGKNKEKFLANQRVLLRYHEFYTQEAKKLFPHQAENLRLVEQELLKYQ